MRTALKRCPLDGDGAARPCNGTDPVISEVASVALGEVLEAAMMATRAALGNIQLLDGTTGTLKIVAQRGFGSDFLEFFGRVHEGQAACGTSLTHGRRIVVEDVTDSPIFLRTSALELMLDAGARAVQSTPLFGECGRILGVLSTHYRQPCRLREDDARRLDLAAHRAARLIER
jgi:hypothetical protein